MNYFKNKLVNVKLGSNQSLLIITALLLLALLFVVSYFKQNTSEYLQFSDGAKFASVARNINMGNGYQQDFMFFGKSILNKIRTNYYPAFGIPQVMPYSILIAFLVNGASDLSVIATSSFYFILLIITTYLLGKKLFNQTAGFLAAAATVVNINLLGYATSGASEPAFMFFAVLAAYFLLGENKKVNILSIIPIVLMYFVRPQAFVFIFGFLLFYLVKIWNLKKASVALLALILAGIIFDKYVLYPLSFKYPISSIYVRGKQAIQAYASGAGTSDAIRGGLGNKLTLIEIGKKYFWNMYNFYKFLPKVGSYLMIVLFGVSLLVKESKKETQIFKYSVLLIMLLLFTVVALTIPLLRYLHPIIPFVYVIGSGFLVKVFENLYTRYIKNKDMRSKLVTISAATLVFVFVVLESMGAIFLDSRFTAKRINKGKPPVYVELSEILQVNTDPNDVVITNLDTWGSWYGERKTVWFPLKPEQLVLEDNNEIYFDAIYLTSYLIDDENYYMGDEWRQIFYNPEDPENEYIAENYELKEIFEIDAEDVYEKQNARAVLLTRKTQ